MEQQANAFLKTRQEHASETSEDYVEAVLRLAGNGTDYSCDCAPKARTAEIARFFDVSQPTVTKTLNKLQEEGLVCIHRRQFVHLTQAGADLAHSSLARHTLIVRFLVAIGVPVLQAELDTEGIEHHISPATLEAMRSFIAGR